MLTALIILYWLPTVVALVRNAQSALGIFLVNLFLGWTVLFWFVALIWSFAGANRHEIVVRLERGSELK